MSLILDALRKMEEERAARRSGSVDIRPAVLNRNGDNRPAAGRPALLVAAGVILLLAGIGAGVLLKGAGSSQPPAHPAEGVAETGDRATATQLPASPQPAPAPAEPATMPAAAVPAAPPAPPPHRTVTEPAAAAPEEPEPGLAISGIAWQEERVLRRAVVNGALLGGGAEVAGARIVEIRERSVRFSRGGRTFEVSYASAFPSR